jgi:hypothetical protein
MTAIEDKKQEILRGFPDTIRKSMPDTARVWIYQSTRPFTEIETIVLTSQINGFVGEWTAHRKTLLAAGAVYYNQFIVLSVDESLNEASGCSIDASVYFIKDIENQYNVQLFERMNFAYLDGETAKTVPSTAFSQLYTEGSISDDTLVFDNLVNTVAAFKTAWLKPLKSSWHRRFV